MEPKIVTLSEKKLVGLGTNFISIRSPERNNHILIPKLWDQYLKLASDIKHRIGANDFGLCEAVTDPKAKKHPDECFYMACAEVSDFETVPQGMLCRTVPAGRYAVFTHKGTLDKLQHTMNYIYGSWASKTKEELRDAPDLELYDQRFNPNSEDSELDIYIPISDRQ